MSTDSAPARAPLPAAAPGSPEGPAPPPPHGRTSSASACEPYRELIEDGVRRRRNAVAIYQDLVTLHGFTAKYASGRRFVRTLVGHVSPEARAVIQTAPGEEAQVDYGTGPRVRDPKTGKYRRMRLFVMTLGYSRKAVRLLTFQSSARICGRTARGSLSASGRGGIGETGRVLLALLEHGEWESSRALAHAAHVSESTTSRSLGKLAKYGLAERKGRRGWRCGPANIEDLLEHPDFAKVRAAAVNQRRQHRLARQNPRWLERLHRQFGEPNRIR